MTVIVDAIDINHGKWVVMGWNKGELTTNVRFILFSGVLQVQIETKIPRNLTQSNILTWPSVVAQIKNLKCY